MSKKDTGGQRRNEKLAVVILALSSGTGTKSRKPMALREAGGATLLSRVMDAAKSLVATENLFVAIGQVDEKAKAALAENGVHVVEAGRSADLDALANIAREKLAEFENMLCIAGDVAGINAETLKSLWRMHTAKSATMTIAMAGQVDPKGKNCEAAVFICRTAPLLLHLGRSAKKHKRVEDFVHAAAGLLRDAGERVAVLEVDEVETQRVDTLAKLVALDAATRAASVRRLMKAGVTILQPETCVIDRDVEVGPDTVIEPFVQLLGGTKVGSGCRIRSYSVIENCRLGDRIIIRQSCVLADSAIAHGADIGPFARMRPGCDVGEDVHIGNFVELKKAKLHKGVKAGHLSYLGDTEIGAKANIGAGVITCNYDGVTKHLTRIGTGAFVGSDSTLVAPVTIEDGAYIGAASCITKDVPAGALAVARAHQLNMEGWVAARRAKREAKASAVTTRHAQKPKR